MWDVPEEAKNQSETNTNSEQKDPTDRKRMTADPTRYLGESARHTTNLRKHESLQLDQEFDLDARQSL